VQIRGAHGEHTETNDHIYDISNKRRLGLSEVDLVQDMYNGVKAMIESEKKLQKAAAPAGGDKKEEECKAGTHLKKPEDITGFPVFPEGTKSLLSKCLTRDVWNKLKDAKDKHDFTLRQAILSGAQNVESGIGVYAGSHDSYTAFAPLFDDVIEQYHGHKKGEQHMSDMDHTKLKCPPFPEEDAKMIKSTRIRVGRNLADFPLGPGLTKEQRQQVEEKVVTACKAFTGDLEGKYYSLGSLSEADRQQLIDDHFLFKEGDKYLEACGLNREWPEGRGIFHNNEKTFLVWVNEEDQLRIISMQPGADIGAVFSRLSRAAADIEKVAKFAHDSHLGYITSCPTNLGTAMRASVHIHLPNLGAKKNDFEAIADKYFVQIRGAHGEHTETNDHVYDISNKRRLGRSEVDLVMDMYNGVKEMIEAEKKLAAAAKPAQ
jgi:arginine kinase